MAEGFGPREQHLLQECIHCGFCLPACPTYTINGMEMDSPRGRLYLMEAAMENRVALSARYFEHMDRCLVCRACETACPSGVKFGDLMERTRAAISPARKESPWKSWLSRTGLRNVIPSHLSLSILFGGAWVLERTGLKSLLTRSPLRKMIPERIKEIQGMLPTLRARRFGRVRTRVYPASGQERGTVALFTGCVMDHIYPQVHAATVRILTWHGYEVTVPGNQTCCGALHIHNGDEEAAARLAEKTAFRFRDSGAGAIVVNAAGCGAHLKEYANLYGGQFSDFTGRIQDLTEFLVRTGLSPPKRDLPMRVAYDEACHLIHGQGITREPKFLIEQIPGIESVRLEEADRCCGSAGTYSITEPTLSLEVLNRKMKFVDESGAEAVVTTNPGCQIQLDWGIRRKKLNMRALHIAELLDRAYSLDPRYRDRPGE
ncbi:MAG: (Fe-S)-binding protein [Fidelibacterota bacterium]